MRNLVCAFISLLLLGCDSNDETLFTQLEPNSTGIDFVNRNTETEKSNILTYEYFYNGGGVALGDINNDGLLDVYLSSTIYENKLYLNLGNLKFKDITAESGTDCKVGWKTGVSMVDINGDGFLDIYVCRSASPDPERRRNILLVNNGNNTFIDKAKEYNLDDDSYSTQAAFFDFDHDDDLDVILLNHSTLDISNSFLINVRNSTVRFPHVGNKFLKNENGKFIDVSDSVGIYGPASNYGLGISLSDVNNDGWIDIYTGCDYTGRDRLLLNQQGKSFLDATDTLSHISKFTMGTDIADFNGDGLMDIYSVDMLPEDNQRQKQLLGSDKIDAHNEMVKNGLHHQYMRNMLHLNNGDGSFSEVGQLAGISNTDWSWASLFADFDNDGIQDLFVSNGFKRDLTNNDFTKYEAFQEILVSKKQGKKITFLETIDKLEENKIPNYIFKGSEKLSFKNVTKDWGLDEASLTNGAAYGDLDNDGDLDLVTNNINDPAGVYRNNTSAVSKNNFLRVKLIGEGKNKSAIGAKVILYSNGKLFARENLPVRGFQSSVQQDLHFGLGTLGQVDSLFVIWPNGNLSKSTGSRANQMLKITEENSKPSQNRPSVEPYFTQVSNATIPSHVENDFVDFRVQALLPRLYSQEGPAMASADVNGDGLLDLFVGGAKGAADQLLFRKKDGAFIGRPMEIFDLDKGGESVDAAFVDVDGDKDLDLYVVKGGYEFDSKDPLLQDKLYLNDGQGNFRQGKLTELLSSGSCVIAGDVEGDGDQDLFVGGRIVPGRYPETPESTLLINDGKGNFSVNEKIPESLRHAGMVTDALWVNVNDDEYPDLIVVGEWMPVKVFINEKGSLSEQSSKYGLDKSTGLWNCIIANDFDGDGDNDFIAGNLGLNSQFTASPSQPMTLVYDDFDRNGSVDPILNYHIKGKSYPYPTRDELLEQLPSFKKRFTDYKSYSNAQIQDVLSAEQLGAAKTLSANILETCLFRNDNGKFTILPLPVEAQFAPLFSLAQMDIDEDGILDLLTGGNISGTRARTGKMTGNSGFVFRADGKGNFLFIPPTLSGINIRGDVREILTANNELMFSVNNGPVSIYKKQ